MAVDESGKLVEITNKLTDANKKQSKSLIDAQKDLENKRKELSAVNKSIKESTTATDADAASKLRLTQDIKVLSSEINKNQSNTIALNNAVNLQVSTYDDLG